jgi:hypothetical protein
MEQSAVEVAVVGVNRRFVSGIGDQAEKRSAQQHSSVTDLNTCWACKRRFDTVKK